MRSTAPDPKVIRAKDGGVLEAPITVFECPQGQLRDHTMIAVGTTLHMFFLWATDARTVGLHHCSSRDQGKTWSKHQKVQYQADARIAWIKAFAPNGSEEISLLAGSSPSDGAQDKAQTNRPGEQAEGGLGMLWFAKVRALDPASATNPVALRLINPGDKVYAQHPFRSSFQLLSVGGRLSLVGSTAFQTQSGKRRVNVWGLVAVHSADDGETWSKVHFLNNAYPGLQVLRPAMFAGLHHPRAVTGHRTDEALVIWLVRQDGSFTQAPNNLSELLPWNFWYDVIDEGDKIVITDTVAIRTGPGPTYGIVEVESTDRRARSWARRRIIDLELGQPYAARSLRSGEHRAHVAWNVAAFSSDDGMTWTKVRLPDAFAAGHPCMISGRGLGISAAVEREGKGAALRVVVYRH